MKKFIILSLAAIVLTAYGGLTSKSLVKEKNSISYSIQANDLASVSTSYAVADLPQARAREVSIQDLRNIVYGPEVLLAENRFNWQDRSNRLWIKPAMTAYKPIAKPHCTLMPMAPPKIC